jgi:hypothetical protein
VFELESEGFERFLKEAVGDVKRCMEDLSVE